MGDSIVQAGQRPIGAELSCGPLGFGCWRLTDPDPARAQALVETALDAGMTLIDTADVYGLDFGGSGFGAAEEILGGVLRASPGLRERMLLASKGGIVPPLPYDSSARALSVACEASLRRLGVEQLDLYQIHRPDLFAHPAEVAAALTRLRESGKIREVGVSNFTPAQTDALAAHLPFPIVTSQPELSALQLQPLRDGTLDRCMREGVTPLAWSPLAGGRLVSGRDVPPALLAILDRLAEREGADRAAVALAFVLAHPSRPVAIVGSQRPERLREAPRALSVRLDRQDCYDVVVASEGVPLP